MYRRLYYRYYKVRAAFRRRRRLLFPSPAELKLIVLLGGKVKQFKWLRDPKTDFPLAYIYKKPSVFKSEFVKREVRCGPYFIDFGNDIGRGIEIDGRAYHTDVVAAFDRDSYLYQRGWMIKHIPAVWLWNNPNKAQQEIIGHLTK